MKSSSLRILILMVFGSALLLAAQAAGAADSAKKHAVNAADPAAYCVQTGGLVEERRPFYGTNGGNPLRLAGKRKFCQYTAEDGSRIHVLIKTLYANKPSLAVLAYYSQEEIGGGCTGNPASCYCTQLGGSDLFGGVNAAGGGWVLKGAIDETLEACIFPDMSSIDSWGLAYHSAGIIRGIDLSTVLRFQNPK